jgi:hypothetical protein
MAAITAASTIDLERRDTSAHHISRDTENYLGGMPPQRSRAESRENLSFLMVKIQISITSPAFTPATFRAARRFFWSQQPYIRLSSRCAHYLAIRPTFSGGKSPLDLRL